MAKVMKGVYTVTRKGVVYWYARLNGRPTYCGKGDKGRKIAEAAKAKEITQKYENREIQSGLKTKRVELRSVRALFLWYLELPEVQKLGSYDNRVDVAGHFVDFFGSKPITACDPDGQRAYRKYRTEAGAAPATINHEIDILCTALNAAFSEDKITSEQMPKKFMKDGESLPRRLITDDEYAAILAACDNSDFSDLLVCAYESAMRVTEIVSLTAEQVRLGIRHISGCVLDYIYLGVLDTKTGAERTVPVSAALKDVLDRRLEGIAPDALVFTIDGKRATRHTVLKRFQAVCKRAGIIYGDKPKNARGDRSGIVIHSFRGTRVSRWVEAGFSDEIVMRASGHRSLAAYRKYVHLDARSVMRLVENQNATETLQKSAKLSILQ